MPFPDIIDAYHAGERRVLEDVAERGIRLTWSTQDREWLGHGVYFWGYSLGHAKRWVDIGSRLNWWGAEGPAILETKIELKNCLNLLDPSSVELLDAAATMVKKTCVELSVDLPENSRYVDGVPVERRLDCAIINQVHQIQHIMGRPAFDTVLSGFEDGAPYLPGATFRRTSHIQIAVRNHDCIQNSQIAWVP